MSKKTVVKPTEDEKFLAWVKGNISIWFADPKICDMDCCWFDKDFDDKQDNSTFCDLFCVFLKGKDSKYKRTKKCLKFKKEE